MQKAAGKTGICLTACIHTVGGVGGGVGWVGGGVVVWWGRGGGDTLNIKCSISSASANIITVYLMTST